MVLIFLNRTAIYVTHTVWICNYIIMTLIVYFKKGILNSWINFLNILYLSAHFLPDIYLFVSKIEFKSCFAVSCHY